MNIKDRIGVDCGRKLSVEDAVQWAVDHDVRYIDCQIDVEPNALRSFDAAWAICGALPVSRLLKEFLRGNSAKTAAPNAFLASAWPNGI